MADVARETCRRRTRTILIRHGRWKDDLDESGEEDAAPEGLADLYAASLRGVLVFGARRGQRMVRLFGQAAPRWSEEPRPRPPGAFDVHARQAVLSRRPGCSGAAGQVCPSASALGWTPGTSRRRPDRHHLETVTRHYVEEVAEPIERLTKVATVMAEAVERELFVPASPGWYCAGCQFREACRRW